MRLNDFKKDLVCWGASDQCVVIRPIVEALGGKISLLVDDTPGLSSPFDDVALVRGKDGLDRWLRGRDHSQISFLITIANPYGFVRYRLHNHLKQRGLTPLTLVDSSAIIDQGAVIGEGSQIMRGVVVNAEAQIGVQCILNTGSIVEHHCLLKRGVELAPGATLCGRVFVDDYTCIGAGATVLPRYNIGRDVIIGAGSLVRRDVEDEAVFVGNPATFLKRNVISSRSCTEHL